jgi:hypothetical protein
MNSSLKIMWVEVGRPIPRYAKNNFKLTSKLHSNITQYLITDSRAPMADQIIIDISKMEKSEETRRFEEIKKVWPHKQEYFWHGTTARFFYLYDAMRTNQLNDVIHLETDCILLQPEAISNLISDTRVDFAFPLQANGIGCASILYARNPEILQKFLHHILNNWNRDDVDDMVLLGEFSQEIGVNVLPTQIENLGPSSGFIFDAQSIGKYFMGTDARNCRIPFSFRGELDSRKGSITNLLKQGSLRFKSTLGKETIEIRVKGSSIKLANIHIHSKAISPYIFFMNMKIRIGFGFKTPIIWKLGHFDKYVFLERLVSFWARRLQRNKNFSERILR